MLRRRAYRSECLDEGIGRECPSVISYGRNLSLGKFDQYADGQRMLRAEKRLYKKLDEEKGKQNKILRMRRWMKYAAVIAIIFAISGGIGYWFYHNGTDQQ